MSHKIYYLIVALLIFACQPQIILESFIITDEYIIGSDMSHLNIFNRAPMHLLSTTKIGERSYSMELKDNILFTASESKGIRLYNISNPSKPMLISSYKTGGNARKIILRDEHLFVANSSKKVLILDISDPKEPKLVSKLALRNNPSISDFEFEDDILYVSLFKEGIVVINVSDPYNPNVIGNYPTDAKDEKPSERFGEISINNKTVYLNVEVQRGQCVLRIINFAHPVQPNVIKDIEIEDYLFHSTIEDTVLYLVQNNTLSLFSVINPMSPELIGDFNIPDISLIDVDDDSVYVATLDLKLKKYSFSDLHNPIHLLTYDYSKQFR